jgi:CheY-like chemotaxis protein
MAGIRQRQCLVVSNDLSHRLLLSQAAKQVGWQTIEAASAEEGQIAAMRSTVDLAIIDLETNDDDQSQDLLTMVERLSDHRNRLLMVCGNHQRPEEEVWARQLGVWIYVPGLDDSAYEDGADVTALCSHAGEIVDRWSVQRDELCGDIASNTARTKTNREQRTMN